MTDISNFQKLTFGLMVVALFAVAFNSFQIMQLTKFQSDLIDVKQSTNNVVLQGNNSNPQTPIISEERVLNFSVIPTGIPAIYGEELGISFDDVSPETPQRADATIEILAEIDRETTLTGNDLDRYINAAGQITCEYCCSAKSIITPDGQAACGCAHSYAMRGLAKYLIINHPDEFSDAQILEELGKWKALFFPQQLSQKANILNNKGIELNYINLASNKYLGIEKDASGGMVGGC